jgi:membrane peptidoglycan carboxypeptidase
VRSPLKEDPTIALGTTEMPLIELASAYAAFAAGRYPVTPATSPKAVKQAPYALDREKEWAPMLDLLWHAANVGTGRRAALAQPTFGKTGTSQDGRDALFVGFAGDLVTAVWVGRDDNKPLPGSSGGRLPAAIWRAFMAGVPLARTDLPLPQRRALLESESQWPGLDDIYAGFERLTQGIPEISQMREYLPDAATIERYAAPAAAAIAAGGANEVRRAVSRGKAKKRGKRKR